MKLANEGKKSLSPKANFMSPLGCGCQTSSLTATARDSFCACACSTTSGNTSAHDAGYNV
ncbi:hypothetical protein D3C76_98290 [compost metagenome]